MKRQLWLRLEQYNFNHLVPTHLWHHVRCVFGGPDASTRAFADKLSRKLGWHTDFALRAIAEYKRFVFLGVVSDFGVTPSKIIDQVWHEHLLFSRAYRDFCSQILGCDFDHNPELVPVADETGIFSAQYQQTLALYEAEFNAAPPADIWSTPKFQPDKVKPGKYKPRLKSKVTDYGDAGDGDDTPLHEQIDGLEGSSTASSTHHHFSGYGGGDSGGGGASSFWGGDHHSSSGSSSHSSMFGDHSGDSGSSSGDSGSSDSEGVPAVPDPVALRVAAAAGAALEDGR